MPCLLCCTELDLAHVHERVLARVGRQYPLTTTVEYPGADFAPLGLPTEHVVRVLARLGASVSGRNQRHRLATVLELKMSRHPYVVAQVRRRLDDDARESRKRHPVVAPIDDRLEYR